MGYYAVKTDANMKDVLAALRRVPGLFVHDLSAAGRGVPDLLTCRYGTIRLLEVKNVDGKQGKRRIDEREDFDPDGELTDDQVRFASALGAAGGRIYIVHSPEEAVRVVASCEDEIRAAVGGER